ncbi:MAG: hypothetical protein IKY44_01465 [Clostridia bacterium]|nr:hypothetical protein [Clostridia bacterium]
MSKYIFREIEQHEIPEMFEMVLARMRWMDEVGIRQWNVTKYDEVYPMSYYEGKRQKGENFVLVDTEKNQIVCAGVIKDKDDRGRWADVLQGEPDEGAVYLHHLVTRLDAKGSGIVYIEFAEKLARERGKKFFRLDSAVGNVNLERYYTMQDYYPVGQCVDGLYHGILREKKL